MARATTTTLHTFITECVAENNAFALLQGLTTWLREGGSKRANERFLTLIEVLKNHPDLCAQMASLLCQWLCRLRLYPLFISAGIFAREGFARELGARIYEKFNPSHKELGDLRDVFAQLFCRESDTIWLDTIAESSWLHLFALLRRHASETERKTVQNHVRREGLHAIEMLSIWVAAEALEPDLLRLDPQLLNRDSSFVALKREVSAWLNAKVQETEFDDSHLYVMLDQCRKQVETLRKKGTGAGAGSSMSVAHLLERLNQTFDRIELLLQAFNPTEIPPSNLLQLTAVLVRATAEQNSVARLWKSSVRMLSRSITQNTSGHGEHYITRNLKEYRGMLLSAAGGGVLIALMSLLKIYLGKHVDNQFVYGVLSGLNYGLGFAVIFMLGFTVATKQPAMTASKFAAVVERNDKGQTVNMKLAQLLVDVLRSQVAAVVGNVLVAMTVAAVIALVYGWTHDFPLLNKAEVQYQLQSIDPRNATLWYAAIAGVWLFCSGIISGFFDNRCDYLNLRMRLRHHPLFKRILPEKWRARFADYMHENYGSLMGNVCFGMLLGMTGFIGHALGLPFDIRHVAFSSANVGYAAVAGSIGFWVFVQSVIFVLMIGTVNLWVSFSLTLWVALRSRETRIESWWGIFKCVWQIAKERPLSLLLPLQLPPQSEPPVNKKNASVQAAHEGVHKEHK